MLRASRRLDPIADVGRLNRGALDGMQVPPFWKQPTPREKRMQMIQRVADRHGVSLVDVMGADRDQAVSHARFEAMYRVRARFGDSLSQIGRLFGRHHTTVLHALQRYEEICNAR